MKLYYKPGACSLASHILLRELGMSFELEKVDTKTQKTENGSDYSKINPNGYVPALELDNGDILLEGAAILQYLADQKPEAGLSPKLGSIERARLQQHLNFVASELHKAFSPFFANPAPVGEARAAAETKLAKRLDYVESLIADGRTYLLGDQFSVADSYLFVVANWSKFIDFPLTRWPHVEKYVSRVAALPKVTEAMRAEGLLK